MALPCPIFPMNRNKFAQSITRRPFILANTIFAALLQLLAFVVVGRSSALGHEVLVCSYFTTEGTKIAAPTPEHPALCSLVANPAREWDSISNQVERLLPESMRRLVGRALGVNSFLPVAENPQSANLIVVYHWGWACPVIADAGTREEHFFNQTEMLGIVGGPAFERLTAAERTAMLIAARDERFFVIVSAYDANDWARHKRRTLLWRTHMSMPSHRLTPRQAAPILLSAGAGLFGRDTLGVRSITIDVLGSLRTDADTW